MRARTGTHTQVEHNMLSMEMDAVDITNIVWVCATIPSQKNTQTPTDACTRIQTHCWTSKSVNEDRSHCLAGVTVFYRCKVTSLCQNTKHAADDLRLHTSLLSVCVCVCIYDIFTFSTQFLWPGTEPLTYSTLYLVLTLHIWKREREKERRQMREYWTEITVKDEQVQNQVYVCLCVLVSVPDLQSITCDVHVSHHAGHLFPFENFGWILDTDDEQHTRSHYWIMKSQLFMSGTEESLTQCVWACVYVLPLQAQKLLVCDEFWFAHGSLADLWSPIASLRLENPYQCYTTNIFSDYDDIKKKKKRFALPCKAKNVSVFKTTCWN